MKGEKSPLGYTIVEVMIVLAVSGVMFLIAASFISGKQENTAFTEGANQMASEIQNTISQVIAGKYSDIPLNCTYDSIAGTNPNVSGFGSPGQGANPQCMFLGKMLYFVMPLPTTNYETVSVAGGRVDSSGNPITDLTTAKPAIITDLTTDQITPQSLDIGKITVNGGSTTTPAIGFLQSQGSTMNGTTLANGAQTVGLYYYTGSATDFPSSPTASSALKGSNIAPAQSIDLCITDSIRYADITLGVTGGQLNATVKMDGQTRPATC